MNSKIAKVLPSLIFSFLGFLSSAKLVFGQSPGPTEDITGKIYNPILPPNLSATSGMTFLQNLLKTGISLAFVVGGLIFFFMLLTGGVRWMSAGSDKGKLEGAQKQITHALVGLAILLLSFAIIELIGYLFGIDLLKISLPTL